KKNKKKKKSKQEKKKKKRRIKRAHMYVIHTIRRKIYKYLKQLPFSDAYFPVEGYINLYTLFDFFFEKHINIRLRDVKSIFYRYWKEWLRVAARVTVVEDRKSVV